jgi:hypothetical protein
MINLEYTTNFKFKCILSAFFAAYDAQIAGLFYEIYVTSAGFQVFLVTMIPAIRCTFIIIMLTVAILMQM